MNNRLPVVYLPPVWAIRLGAHGIAVDVWALGALGGPEEFWREHGAENVG